MDRLAILPSLQLASHHTTAALENGYTDVALSVQIEDKKEQEKKEFIHNNILDYIFFFFQFRFICIVCYSLCMHSLAMAELSC